MHKNKYNFKPFKEEKNVEVRTMDISTIRKINANVLDLANNRDIRNPKKDIKSWQYELMLADGCFN